MYTPKHLKRWTLPDSYSGEIWPNYYSSGFGRSRDSDALEESNFRCAWKALEPLGAELVREGHWAVGWVEWIAIHEDHIDALKAADEMCEAVEGYPILNEHDLSELEHEQAQESWNNSSLKERISMCSEAGISIFAARQEFYPSDDSGFIQQCLLGY